MFAVIHAGIFTILDFSWFLFLINLLCIARNVASPFVESDSGNMGVTVS